MTPRHVISLVAIFVCNLLLSCAQSAPNAALLKLLAAKHSQDNGNSVSLSPSSSAYSSYINDYNPTFPASPSADDVSELWLDPSSGRNPVLMRTGNSLTSAGRSSTAEEEAKDSLMEASKRFHPSAFFGSRGKRGYGGLSDAYPKRFFHQAFVGSRGKRLPAYGMGGEEEEEEEEEAEEEGKRMMLGKRFNPAGFTGSRGKRYLPGLEALFLSQMYKKLDAEKWKRQSLLGFHAARG
ncbi:hypothetical protein ACOMHN_023814 [Nucella lapillus]